MGFELRLKRDTAANWTSNNPTLEAGRPGYETDTGRLKIGDEATAWTSLKYALGSLEFFEYALSDETTTITTGTAKLTARVPYAFKVLEVRSSLNVVSSSGLVTVDINEAGSTILSTKLSIDASEKTSKTAATPAVISDTTLADDAELTFDIDAAGTGAAGLKVKIFGYRTA